MNNTEYKRIQEIWGKPEMSKPTKKNQAEQEHCQDQSPNKKHRKESHRPASGPLSTGTPAPPVGKSIKETQCQYKRMTDGQKVLTNLRKLEKQAGAELGQAQES